MIDLILDDDYWGLGSYGDLALWLDADVFIESTDASAVATWTDLSGNGYDLTQGTGSAQPKVNLDSQNGRPGVTFDGGDHLAGPAGLPAAFAGEDVPFTFFFVAKASGSAPDGYCGFGRSVSNNGEIVIVAQADGSFLALVESDAGVSDSATSATSLSSASAEILTWKNSGSTSDVWLSGTKIINGATVDTGSHTPDTFFLGARAQGGSPAAQFSGDIYHVLLYAEALSDTDIGRIETDLAGRYNISLS